MSAAVQPGLQRAVDEQHIAQEKAVRNKKKRWNSLRDLTQTVRNFLIHTANDEVKPDLTLYIKILIPLQSI